MSLPDEAAPQVSGDFLETEIAPKEKPGAGKTKSLESLRFPSRFQALLLARSTGLEPVDEGCPETRGRRDSCGLDTAHA
jgi:hypothetical protein